MELFYHAFHETVPGLVMYEEIWKDLLKECFKVSLNELFLVSNSII